MGGNFQGGQIISCAAQIEMKSWNTYGPFYIKWLGNCIGDCLQYQSNAASATILKTAAVFKIVRH